MRLGLGDPVPTATPQVKTPSEVHADFVTSTYWTTDLLAKKFSIADSLS